MNYLRFSSSLRLNARGFSKTLVRSNVSVQEHVKEHVKVQDNEYFKKKRSLTVKIGKDLIEIKKEKTFENEQKKLFERHKYNLLDEPTNLFDVIDLTECYLNSTRKTMLKALNFLEDPNFDCSLLSDRQLSIIFRISGDLNVQNNSSYKDGFTNKFFNILQEKNTKFGILGLNSYFSTKLLNGNPLSVNKFYELLSKYEVEPNLETFELLAEYHASNGDSKSVLELIKVMKEVDFPVTTKVLGSLIEALVASDNVEKARNLILSSEKKKDSIGMKSLKLSFIKGLAFSKKFDALVKAIGEFDKNYITAKPTNAYLLFEPLIIFAKTSENIEQVETILKMIPPFKSNFTADDLTYIGKFYVRCLDFIYDGNVLVASTLMKALPKDFLDQIEDVIVNKFLRNIAKEEDSQNIAQAAAVLTKQNIVENPLLLSLSKFNYENEKKFLDVFEIFKASNEYQLFENRFFVQKANFKYLVSKINKTKKKDEKAEIVEELLQAYYTMKKDPDNNDPRKLGYLNTQLLKIMLDDNLNLFKRIIERKTNFYYKDVTQELVRYCLFNEKYDILKNIIDIMKDNSVTIRPYMYLLKRVEKVLKENKSTPLATSSCCSLLSCFFNKEAFNLKNEIIDIITGIVVNNKLSDSVVSSMFDQWGYDGTILLSKSQVDTISEKLTSVGLVSRIPFLEKIIQKSNTVLRWLGTEDIMKLEKELMHLETLPKTDKKKDPSLFLRTIIVSKHIQKTPVNFEAVLEHLTKIFKSNYKELISRVQDIPTKTMKNLVKENRSIFADELWNIENIIIDTDAALLYAFNLYLRNEIDKMNCVFNEIKDQVKSVTKKTTSSMSNFLPDVDVKTIDGFSNLLNQKFNVAPETTNVLNIACYKTTFQQLLSENNLDGAFDMAKKISSITSSSYGQIDLMSKSIKQSNTKLFNDVLQWLKSMNSDYSAYIDAAIALLENGKMEVADKTLKSLPNLMFSEYKLDYIISREQDLNNVDVLKFILNYIYDKDWSSDSMTNKCLSAILKIYDKQGLLSEITKFKETLEKNKFPFTVEADLMFKKYS